MKKLLIIMVVFMMAFSGKTEAKQSDFSLTIWFGRSTGFTGCERFPGICRIDIQLKSANPTGVNSDSEVIAAKGELQNDVLKIVLPKGIQEKGRNEHGMFSFSVIKEMSIDPMLAKELGVEKLVIAPGNYEFKGNTLALKIVSPRETGSGLPTGKRQHGAVTISK